MKVAILCGGQGTRLREETEFRPKPLVDVGGRPILWHIMKTYAHYGLTDFVLCLGYRGEMIKDYFLRYQAMNNDFTIELGKRNRIEYHGEHEEQDFRVTLAETGLNAMTGSRVRRAARFLGGDTFMVTYGDGLADINVRNLLAFHQSHCKLATVTVVQAPSRFGVVEFDADRRVTSFAEKPQLEGLVNAGYFVFQRQVLDYLAEDDTCVLEREPMERLAADNQLMAYCHDGFFFAMDTYREFEILNRMWASGNAPWRVWR